MTMVHIRQGTDGPMLAEMPLEALERLFSESLDLRCTLVSEVRRLYRGDAPPKLVFMPTDSPHL